MDLEIIAYSLLVIYFGLLILIFWLFIQSIKNQKKVKSVSLLICLVTTVIFPGLSWGILPGSSIYHDLVQTHKLTGTPFLLGKAKLTESSERSYFNGDGYYIGVYSISEKIASKFKKPSTEFFENYPVKFSFRSHWEVAYWKKTQLKASSKELTEFAKINVSTEVFHPNNPRHTAFKLLTEEGNYFSYFYYLHGERFGNIDLFILSPKRKLLVIINHNT